MTRKERSTNKCKKYDKDVRKFSTLSKNKVLRYQKRYSTAADTKKNLLLDRWKKELHIEKYRKYRKT